MTARTADASGHQLLIRLDGGRLGVTCTCLRVRVRGPEVQARNKAGTVIGSWRPSYTKRTFIESRTRFPAAEAVAVWRAWHERGGSSS